jgi:hypothetical protein
VTWYFPGVTDGARNSTEPARGSKPLASVAEENTSRIMRLSKRIESHTSGATEGDEELVADASRSVGSVPGDVDSLRVLY